MIKPDEDCWYTKYSPSQIIEDYDFQTILCDMKDGSVVKCDVTWYEDDYPWTDQNGETIYESFTTMVLTDVNTGSYIDATDILKWMLLDEKIEQDMRNNHEC